MSWRPSSKDPLSLGSDLRPTSCLRASTRRIRSCRRIKKIFKVDDHIGVAIAGLTTDVRNECINHKFVYESPLAVGRLVVQLADKAQRPYGVGLLVAGLDESGVHLYYNCPSRNYFEYQAFAIGSRSQAAKTYLERKFESFADYTRDELIKDTLFAIKETLQGEKLTSLICTVAVLGVVGESFHVMDQNTIQQLIETQEIGEEAPAAADANAPASDEQGT